MREPSDTKILVACEFSGVVRDAFLDRGFNFRNFPPHVAYTTTYKRSNRHYIRSIFTYEPFELTDYAILVKDLIEDDEW